MSVYVVTGGTGFIGQSLSHYLRGKGHEVLIASRTREDEFKDNWIEYDLKNPDSLLGIRNIRPDGIFHLAWSTTPATAELDPAADISTNLVGTVRLLDNLASVNCAKVVLISSGGTVYGRTGECAVAESHPLNPIGVYGSTKLAMEQYALHFHRLKNLDIRIARVSNPFGLGQRSAKMQGAASIFARKVVNDEIINIWGDGRNVRDYIPVSDAVAGVAAIMELDNQVVGTFPVFNVGSGRGLSLLELLQLIETEAGKTARVRHFPARSFDLTFNLLDVSKLRNLSGWIPGDVAEQISNLVRDIR